MISDQNLCIIQRVTGILLTTSETYKGDVRMRDEEDFGASSPVDQTAPENPTTPDEPTTSEGWISKIKNAVVNEVKATIKAYVDSSKNTEL